MDIKKAVKAGIIAGLIMGLALFIGGAVLSRIIYGPQFAPAGKFKPEQLNAWYFIWTKALIGIFFGLLFTLLYEKLPLAKKMSGPLSGLKYGFLLWAAISLWNVSHPLIYGSFNDRNELFWLLYSLCGFLALGYTLGYIYKRSGRQRMETAGYSVDVMTKH